MSVRQVDLLELARRDNRYSLDAYEFLHHALVYTQKLRGKTPPETHDLTRDSEVFHVSGQDLLTGIRYYAKEQFGMMAGTVFNLWGIHSTSDFGRMVYRLIEAGLWFKSNDDKIEDFDDLYDFESAFVDDYEITWDEA